VTLNPPYFTQGDRAYKVYVYGADEEDPSRRIEPGSEHWGEDDAIAEATQLLEAKVGHEGGLWWSACVEMGTWVSYGDDRSDWLEFERDDRQALTWLLLRDGKVELETE
jgi:hypothetical protein